MFNQYSEVLEYCGIPSETQASGINHDLINSSIKLFGFILSENDLRWNIANEFSNLTKNHQTNPNSIIGEVAQSSIYLSNVPSFRSKYRRPSSLENDIQLARASTNISAIPEYKSVFWGESVNECSFTYDRTNNITRKKGMHDITGCPEALHQLRLWSPTGYYLARIGFNVHKEKNDIEKKIISISNVQGIPNGIEWYKKYGIDPFRILIQRLKEVVCIDDKFDIRGLKNPLVNDCLYNTVFKAVGIERFSAPKIGRYKPENREEF